MENEISKFMEVWLSVLVSLSYCYGIGKTIQKGFTRLLFLLPIICLFLYLPLNLSSVHFVGLTSFIIAWLANFKLLLFAFDKGPLSSHCASTSLCTFITLSCFPIKIQEKPSQKSQNNENPSLGIPNQDQRSNLFKYAAKVLILAMLVHVYSYNDYIHPKIKLALYCIHVYLFHDILFAITESMARAMLGLELEPPFIEPYLSTSLEDFWGHRWNLIVSSILRQCVYHPTLSIVTPVIGQKWAPIPAIFGTFLVLAAMHELVFYHIGCMWPPSWEVTWFFVLHAVCLTAEIGVKRVVKDRWQSPRVVSTFLTVGFFIVTEIWFFFPQFIRCRADVRAIEEYATLEEIAKNSFRALF